MEKIKWPLYFKDRLEVGNLDSSIAICCLWTPKEYIKSQIPPDKYAILGQLYTKKGINYILRNVLANPFITKIYLIGNDLMGSGKTLLEFMQGIDKEEFIEKEISKEALDDFRKNVEVVNLIGSEKLAKISLEAKNWDKDKNHHSIKWAKPRTFPDTLKTSITSYPSEIGLTKISRPTIAEAYPAVLKHLMDFGLESEAVITYASDTSKKMKELLNLAVVITAEDSNNPSIPNNPKVFPFTKSDLDSYYNGFFDPNRGGEDYTYGERLYNYAQDQISQIKQIYPWMQIDRFKGLFTHGGFDQITGSIVRKLEKFPYDKGAVALLGNVFSDVFPQRPPKKTPCLFLIQCQIYNGSLNLTAYFRSNDMYNAWPLNAFALRRLQFNLSQSLTTKVGPLVTISNMAHIYEHNFFDAQKIIDINYNGYCEWDTRGNIIVSVEKHNVIAKLFTPDGKYEIRSWKVDGTKPHASRDICFLIDKDLGISTTGNALYVGRQVERAVTAIMLGISYRQDEGLNITKAEE